MSDSDKTPILSVRIRARDDNPARKLGGILQTLHEQHGSKPVDWERVNAWAEYLDEDVLVDEDTPPAKTNER